MQQTLAVSPHAVPATSADDLLLYCRVRPQIQLHTEVLQRVSRISLTLLVGPAARN